jgi:putative transposase
VDYLQEQYPVSGARACGLLHLAVSSYYYQSHGRREETPVREALRRHAAVRRRWGYRRLLVLLRREGFTDNHKRIHRLYRAEGLQVRQRRRRKQRLARGTVHPPAPLQPNERWSLDFVHDRLVNGRTLRLLTIVDDYTRECLWIEADTSLSGPRVTRVLDWVTELRGRPTSLLTDNGPEFAGLALERWAHDHRVQHRFITPGKPSQNAYIESFNGKLRDECLNEHEFLHLTHARDLLETFRDDYNHHRPHSSLDDLTPAAFAARNIAPGPLGGPLDQTNPPLAVPTLNPQPQLTLPDSH